MRFCWESSEPHWSVQDGRVEVDPDLVEASTSNGGP